MSIEQILTNLPASYKANIISQLKALSTDAIAESAHQVAIDLLTIVKELTNPEQKKSLVNPAYAEDTSTNTPYEEGELACRITDKEVILFCDVIKSKTKVGIQYTSREINELINELILSNTLVGINSMSDLNLPLTPSRAERPKWKELASRALIQLVQERYMERPLNSRYLYLVVNPANQTTAPEIPQSNVIADVANDVLDRTLLDSMVDPMPHQPVANLRPSFSNPFPSFAPKPEKYAPTNGATVA